MPGTTIHGEAWEVCSGGWERKRGQNEKDVEQTASPTTASPRWPHPPHLIPKRLMVESACTHTEDVFWCDSHGSAKLSWSNILSRRANTFSSKGLPLPHLWQVQYIKSFVLWTFFSSNRGWGSLFALCFCGSICFSKCWWRSVCLQFSIANHFLKIVVEDQFICTLLLRGTEVILHFVRISWWIIIYNLLLWIHLFANCCFTFFTVWLGITLMQNAAGDHFFKLSLGIICNMMSLIHLFANFHSGSIFVQIVVMDPFVSILCCRAFL